MPRWYGPLYRRFSRFRFYRRKLALTEISAKQASPPNRAGSPHINRPSDPLAKLSSKKHKMTTRYAMDDNELTVTFLVPNSLIRTQCRNENTTRFGIQILRKQDPMLAFSKNKLCFSHTESPIFIKQSPIFEKQSPIFVKQSPIFEKQTPILQTQTQILK